MKKLISGIMIVILLLSLNSGVYANDLSIVGREKVQIGDKGYEFLLDSVFYVNPSHNKGTEIETRSYNPGYGSAKIDDVLMSSSSITDVADVNYTKYETAKYISIRILKKVPGVGDVYSRLEDIYSDLCAVRSVMNSMDTRQAVEVVTRYSTRGFAHKLYVYDYNKTWKDMGYSLSRYYYKHTWMLGYSSDGEVVSASFDYNHSNGYPPEKIAEADHYMDKSWLANKAIEYWRYDSGRYTETY